MDKDKVIFVKYDGVLYAMYRCAPIFEFWQLQADAYTKRLEESDCLMEHHKLAEEFLSQMTPEQAEKFRNIADNKVYGKLSFMPSIEGDPITNALADKKRKEKKAKPMTENNLYLIELGISDKLDYNEEKKVLELTDDFIKEHEIYKVPIRHCTDGAYWSESLGCRKGFCSRFRFKVVFYDLATMDDIARFFNNNRYVAILPTDLGLRVFFSPHRRCNIMLHGKDPKHHTCSLHCGPHIHPYYYVANMDKEDLDFVAKWMFTEKE